MGDLLPPGGGAVYFPGKNDAEPSDDGDDGEKFVICADCNTRVALGDEDLCPICRKFYCEECFEDHDCGFSAPQANAGDL